MVSVDLLKASQAEPETLKHYQIGLNIFFLKLKCGRTLLIYPPHNHRQKWQAPCMSQQKQTGFILVGIIRLKYTIVCLLRYKSIRNNVLSFPRLFEPFCFIFMYISKMLLICTGCKSWLQMM